ncbi:MAG: hypothetical protein AB8B59_03215 [Maribacter sp.]
MIENMRATLGVIPTKLQNEQVQVPNKVISLNQAVIYYNNFYNTRLANGASDTTRAVWFEFKALKNYFNRVINFCTKKNIEISKFAFLLGADENNQRTVFIAPVTYDEQLDLHRAFSFDSDEITFIHRFAGEDYSTIKDFDQLQSLDQSLIFCDSKPISSAEAIALYNNYHDAVTAPFSDVVESDTRFVYYEKGEFEAYLTFLEEQTRAKEITLSGLNIVFAARNNDDEAGIYANRITLFFAPTLEENTKISFSTFDAPKELTLDFSENIWGVHPIKILTSQKSTLFNRGNSAPPPYHWD